LMDIVVISLSWQWCIRSRGDRHLKPNRPVFLS
jgi:hypothetical protein